ncbi:MAG TPA: 50S ribosomal protein L29 [Leucothrix mucor]|nr:50S ribosomal protein L29 [Leucothrix mucor]
MKASELREKSIDELNAELTDNLREQFVFRMQRATGQLKRPSEMKKVRHQIARIKTVLNEMKTSGKE